ERKGDPGADPIHACAWQVKVIDMSRAEPSSAHIRPFVVAAFRREGGLFKTSCAESLGRRICSDFDLQVDDLLWVENFPDLPGKLFVAVFTPHYDDGERRYRVSWRPILKNERAAVAPWC
ncbi:MAG TPA: hypothetical protein VLT88_05725, partial [Desulfosarcina sp.]|nr:hypothetical protein [Desulfosarcina sp.]